MSTWFFCIYWYMLGAVSKALKCVNNNIIQISG